jgi:hypothetical protein
MASNDDVAAALSEFAQRLARHSQRRTRPSTPGQIDAREQRLWALSEMARTMACSSHMATYQAFDTILKEAQRLGAELDPEITIRVATAFVQRPQVREASGT